MLTRPNRTLTKADLLADPHGAKYRGTIEAHDEAFARLLKLLNDPNNEQRLEDAERHDKPALAGIADIIDRDRSIVLALDSADGTRVRQAIGVTIKIKMTKLDWTPTGRKGSASGAPAVSAVSTNCATTWSTTRSRPVRCDSPRTSGPMLDRPVGQPRPTMGSTATSSSRPKPSRSPMRASSSPRPTRSTFATFVDARPWEEI